MADTDSYNYQNLDPKYRQIAEKELNESPERVRAHIASLRRWLQQCTHISNCPSDDRFLLNFLRVSKFNQEKAQARLENYCTVRGSPERGLPHLFKRPSLDDPMVEKVISLGMQIPLGYNDKGEFLVLVRICAFDPSKMDMEKAQPVMLMGAEAMMPDERATIAGCHVIFDLGNMSRDKVDVIFSRKMSKNNARIWQDGFTMRQKGFYYYREPLIFDVIFKMISVWLAPKIVRRVHRVKDDLKKLHERCPGAKQLLPSEYGGEAGTVEDCIGRWRKQFHAFWSSKPAGPPLFVDESKRPPDSIKYLKEYAEVKGEWLGGTEGTYTKIDAM